jgi:hypothetical protein
MALRLTIQRWTDLRSDGWHSGDARCHFLSPHDALLEARAEDLEVVQLLATEHDFLGSDGKRYSSLMNMPAFSGQRPALEQDGRLVAVNTFHTHPVLGRLALLHCHRPVFPLSFGGADQTDDWSLADWCGQCHRKKGLVVWSDPFRFENGLVAEALADLIIGQIDGVECTPAAVPLKQIYRCWSAGIRFPLVGASGKDSNQTALGAMRTYAKIDGEFSLAAWIEAVRAGRSFVTTGQLLRFNIDGQQPGSVLDRTADSAPLKIRAERECAFQTGPLEVMCNGEVIGQATAGGSAPPYSTVLELERPVTSSCWLAARCLRSPGMGFAHTSPIFVRIDGKMPADASVIRNYLESLQRTCEWVETVGRFEQLRRKEQMLAVLEQARQSLLSRQG